MTDNTLDTEIEKLHLDSCHSRQAWIKGMTEPFPCDCPVSKLKSLIADREKKMLEFVIEEDEHHIIVDLGVVTDKCDSYKTGKESDCNCPAGERNQFRREARQRAKEWRKKND